MLLDSTSGKQHPKFTIVCTKADDLNIRGLKRDIKQKGTDEDRAKLSALESDQRNANQKADKQMFAQNLHDFVTAFRDERVKQGLRDAYAQQFKNQHFEVFITSNTTYEMASENNDTQLLQSSGIPDLRRFCYFLAADEQHAQYKHYLKTLVAGLLNSIQMWIEYHDDRFAIAHRELKDMVESKVRSLESGLQEANQTVEKEALESFQNVRGCDRSISRWQAASLEKETVYSDVRHSGWRWNQYAAWCRRGGDYSTKARGPANWDHEYICEIREDLQGPFQPFKNELSGIFEDLIKIKVRKEYEKLKSWTTNMHFPSSIQNGFQFEQDKIANLIRTYEEALKKDIVSIENRALMGNASSFIRAQMKSAYSLAAQDSGRGMRKRQVAIIRGRISGTLFKIL
jgi:hypothetical protein